MAKNFHHSPKEEAWVSISLLSLSPSLKYWLCSINSKLGTAVGNHELHGNATVSEKHFKLLGETSNVVLHANAMSCVATTPSKENNNPAEKKSDIHCERFITSQFANKGGIL